MTHRQLAEIYQRTGKPAPQSLCLLPVVQKYNARKKMVDGHLFDSTGEAEAYRLLCVWETAGAITNLWLQPRFVLQVCTHAITSTKIKASTKKGYRKARNVVYVPDFRFLRDGKTHVVDFKGFQTQAYKIKRSLFRERYPDIVFEEWTRSTLKEMSR